MKYTFLILFSLSTVAFANRGPASVSKEIEMMDSNKDGRISEAEHAAGAQTMFAKMDTNQDKQVTAAEMDVFIPKPARKKLSAAQKIAVIDQNNDGILSAEEHFQGSKYMFNRMDTNHDHYLSRTEVVAGHKMRLRK